MQQLLPQADYQSMPTAAACETVLQRHVIDVWFPRCLDTVHGGFLCDFDRTWRSYGTHEKLLEFQARQTWLAAALLQVAPDHAGLRQAALHGFHFLRDVMWDQQFGGWFHRVQRTGEVLEAHTKHVHGMAYAISACAAVYAATHEPEALALARQGFAWIDALAYDGQHGGYFGLLHRDGTIIHEQSQNPLHSPLDTIGTPVGLKDANVHSDLLETFADLYRLWPDPTVGDRLHEMVDILSHRLGYATGALFFFCQPDWQPVPHVMRYGTALQTASRLLNICDLLHDQASLVQVAQRLVDCSLQYAWDAYAGGVFYAGPAAAVLYLEGHDLVVRCKSWWTQLEALHAFLALSGAVDDNATYLHHFVAQWHYLQRFMLDPQHGGTYLTGLDTLPRPRRRLGARFAPTACTRKGNVWKDGSHDGRVWLGCAALLRAQADSLDQVQP